MIVMKVTKQNDIVKTWIHECKCEVCQSELAMDVTDVRQTEANLFCYCCPVCNNFGMIEERRIPYFVRLIVERNKKIGLVGVA